MYATLEEILADTCEGVRPPERLSVSEAAEKYRYLNNPGSYVGPWDNRVAPYLTEVMDTLTSTAHTGLIFAGPARCGKSDIFMNWLSHTIKCDPADMMVVHMTQSTARDWSTTDLRKLFRHSKIIGERVSKANAHDISFVNGMKLLVKWPTITELSGKTIPRIWLMDMDRMPLDIDKEGSPYQLAKKRTQTFRRFGMTVAESSPGFSIENPQWKASTPHEAPPTQGVLSLYNRGDRRRWYWKCRGCGEAYEPDFSLLRWPDSEDFMESAEQAYIGCPHCGTVVQHDETSEGPGKHGHNLDGLWLRENQKWDPSRQEIVGNGIRSELASFWLKGVAAMFTDWKTLVYNYLQAYSEFDSTGSEESLKTTVNVDQGLPYLPIALETDRLPEELKARSRDYGVREVPEGVRFLGATIDVQRSRFVVQVHGYGVGGDIWILDRFDIRKSKREDDDGDRFTVNPSGYIEDWYLIYEEVMQKTYPLADGSGRHMQIKGTVCDSGGREGVTKNAYDFYRWLRDNPDCVEDAHRRFLLVKGAASKNAPRVQVSYPDSERKDRHAGARGEIPVLFINGNQVKDQANAMLDREDPGGGTVHFPDWLEDWFYAELTAERRTAKGWENPRGARNESWDLLVYSIALSLSRIVRIEYIDWDNPPAWAEEWDDNDLVCEDENNKRFATKEKSEYDFKELAELLA